MKTLAEEANELKVMALNKGTLKYHGLNIAPSIGKTGNMRPSILKGFSCPHCHSFFPVRLKRPTDGQCPKCDGVFHAGFKEYTPGTQIITAVA